MFTFLLSCTVFSVLTAAASLFRPARRAAPLHTPEAYGLHIDDLDFSDPDTLSYYRAYLEDHYHNPTAQRRCP